MNSICCVMRLVLRKRPLRCIPPILVRKGDSISSSMAASWACRSMSRSAIPLNSTGFWGQEANYAGMSFLTLDKLNTLRYGSDIVNVVCDARLEHGPGLGNIRLR